MCRLCTIVQGQAMLMTIGEFERATGLKRSTIGVYENHGLLSPGTARNSYRLYGRDDLEAVEAIKLGKALGFTLREIRSLTEAWYGGRLSTAQKASAIAHKLAECREKRASTGWSPAKRGLNPASVECKRQPSPGNSYGGAIPALPSPTASAGSRPDWSGRTSPRTGGLAGSANR